MPASQPDPVEFACEACGTAYGVSPRTARALAGSRGDPETPYLCWVCVRLRASAIRDAVR